MSISGISSVKLTVLYLDCFNFFCHRAAKGVNTGPCPVLKRAVSTLINKGRSVNIVLLKIQQQVCIIPLQFYHKPRFIIFPK